VNSATYNDEHFKYQMSTPKGWKDIENTVVGDYIKIMKTTFNFNFDFHQGFKQHGYIKTWKHREAVN